MLYQKNRKAEQISMYVICYGKSPKALETGAKLINEIGGRYITGTELITGSFVLAEGDELLSVFAYCNLHNLWKAEA